MSRVVVFGLGPMRWEQSTRLFALGLRTWHFARALARAGHDVLLVSIRGHAYEGWPPEKETYVQREGVRVWSVSEHVCHERPHLVRSRVLRFEPDCVVGVNRDPAAVAVNFAGELPLWADINGDPMAEAQAKAHALAHDDDIPEWHRKFITVLRRAVLHLFAGSAPRAHRPARPVRSPHRQERWLRAGRGRTEQHRRRRTGVLR